MTETGSAEMTKNQNQFDSRVAELRSRGVGLADANRTALAEERARQEQVANETYRREAEVRT